MGLDETVKARVRITIGRCPDRPVGTRGVVWREVGERLRGELPELDEVTSTLKVGSEASPAGREGDGAVRRPRHLREREKLSPALLSLEPTSLPATALWTQTDSQPPGHLELNRAWAVSF